MKKTFYLFFLLATLLLSQHKAWAQPKHSIAFRQSWYNYLNTISLDNPEWNNYYQNISGRGAELSYFNCLFKNTYLVVPLKLGTSRFADPAGLPTRKEMIGNLDVLLQHNFFRYGRLLSPYLHAGVGTLYNFDAKDFGLNFPVAVGLNIRLLENLYASLQTQYRFSTNDLDGWHHGLGVHLFFGNAETPEAPKVLDRDGDGLNDDADRCPDQPGPLATQGCPDADGDGVPDRDDDCPTDKGLAALGGCPDRDGDGIADRRDKCPDQPGPKTTQGCPDRDGDDIVDSEDACPDNPGPAATKGCPDRDGDGIADRDDLCPDKKGTAAGKGCPDTDGDGVYDYEDRCVDKPGPASNKGCPKINPDDMAILETVVKNVQFATGSATLLAKSYPVLDEVVTLMAKYPEYHLIISGHTDSVGDDKLNQALSERRAKACFNYLAGKGAAADRMSCAGYGETRPIADNSAKAGRDKNRRVDFELTIR